jgi:hypothetical protein
MENEVNVLIKTKMGSNTLHDPLGSDDASSDSAKEMNDEYSDASQGLNNQALVERTLCSKSHYEEKLSDSVSDRCSSPSSTSQYHGAPEMKNESVMDPPFDKLNPSSKCQSVFLDESSVSSHPLDVSNSREVHETACSDLHSEENLGRKCHSLTATIDTINPVVDSQVADNTLPAREVYTNDALKVLEADPSGSLSEENITKANSQNVGVSGSVLNHADDNLLIRSDSNGEIGHECERNLQLNTGITSNEMYFDESGHNASGDSSETDPV